MSVVNLTPYAAVSLPSLSRDDYDLTLVVVQGRFHLPPASVVAHGELRPLDEQGEVQLADVYYGDPTTTSLASEGQSAYVRPGTDISLRGDAWAPGGRPAPQSLAGFRVASHQKGAVVLGERVWTPGFGGLVPSRPIPFTSIPLRYERCFGGAAANLGGAKARAADRNPVGRGIYASQSEAVGCLLPNFEDPRRPVTSYADHPPPQGFGPIARHWQPRRALAGTYDDAWLEDRVPLWPADFDERFFLSAPADLQAIPYLVGGEAVRVIGMSPDGAFEFTLPRLAFAVRFDLGRSSIRRHLVLDAVDIDTCGAVLTMTWRAHARVPAGSVAAAIVRCLERWELAA